MEKTLDTTLGHLIFYAKTSTGDIFEIDKLLVYHTRSIEDNDKKDLEFTDFINFSSPNRTNLYGDTLTKMMDYDINKHSKYLDLTSFRKNETAQISREDYYIISGIIDFLIYHNFNTTTVRLNTTLDDKDNYNNAIWEVKNIIQHVKEDLSCIRDRKRPLFIITTNGVCKRAKLKIEFVEKEENTP